MTGNADAVVDVTTAFGDVPATTDDELEARLRKVAGVYLDAVFHSQVLSLRRLIIAEAEQFPDLARRYYEQAPARGIEVLVNRLQPYVDAGSIAADDLRLAAAHFAYLARAPHKIACCSSGSSRLQKSGTVSQSPPRGRSSPHMARPEY
jgi:TetR/AcrR family transcriptional regulator, mexJK operon transcriptional repressor